MNRRTAKLMGYVGAALIQGGMAGQAPVKWPAPATNTAARLKRKLKREWNNKSAPVRNEQRLALIRNLVQLETRHA